MKSRQAYISEGTLKLLKVFSTSRKQGVVLKDAINKVDREGFSEADVLEEFEHESARRTVNVDENTWYIINRLKIEFDYKRQDDFVFDLMVNYCLSRGLDKDCVERILYLD